jgi:hypothetical protein
LSTEETAALLWAETGEAKLMELKSDNSTARKTENQKRTYRSPELLIYGNIREITKNVGPKNNVDGGGGAAAGPKSGV